MDIRNKILNELNKINSIFLGKEDRVLLCLIGLITRGHILIEDVPGVGKTSLVKIMSKLFNLDFNRIQFTNDLLPSDILGINIFDNNKKEFFFKPGPVFTQLLLADELNRTSSRTQSALLQIMEERQVSIDGKTYKLNDNFLVMATQNPRQQIGTNHLPESQLDRFLMKIDIGFTHKEAEIQILKGEDRQKLIENYKSELSDRDLTFARENFEKTIISDALYEYIYRLIDFSRNNSRYYSLSSRTGRDLVLASKCLAWIKNDEYVNIDHVKFLFPFVAGHRLLNPSLSSLETENKLANEILNSNSANI